jgi:hypothetical protein
MYIIWPNDVAGGPGIPSLATMLPLSALAIFSEKALWLVIEPLKD